MKLALTEDRSHVLFIHENAKEFKLLQEFPAFIKGRTEPYYKAVAKTNVVYNIVQRLKARKIALHGQREVLELINAEMKLKAIPASFKYHTQPLDFQEIALRYIYTFGSAGLLLDPGMGKSKIVLDYIWLMQFKKSLIICPKPLRFVWEDEIKTHRPELSFYVVETTDWEQEKEGIANAQVVIFNYDKAIRFEEQLAKVKFDFMHIDEFLIKDHKTARTKSLTRISQGIPYRAGGSGTLINNSPGDLFSPVRYIEPSLIGSYVTPFYNRYAVKVPIKKDGVEVGSRIVNFKFVEELKSILQSCCIIMHKEEWLKNLPQKRFEDIVVPLSQTQEGIIDNLLRHSVLEYEDVLAPIDNGLVIAAKMYQISNGFFYHSDIVDEMKEGLSDLCLDDQKEAKKLGKRKTVFLPENPKIDALSKLIDEKFESKRAILWFNMDAEFEMIEKLLQDKKRTFSVIRGGDKTIGNKVRTFNTDPSIQFLVCQAKSVNYGITVLGTSLEKLEASDYEIFPDIAPEVYTEIFYSLNFSLETYLQQQDRIHRLGQKHECEYYRLFCLSAIEKRIKDAIDSKMSIRREMLVDFIHSITPVDQSS
jgi:SNF2 family DNA or RNA helicase